MNVCIDLSYGFVSQKQRMSGSRPLELPLPLITGNDRSPMLPSYWNQKWEMGIVISVKETT